MDKKWEQWKSKTVGTMDVQKKGEAEAEAEAEVAYVLMTEGQLGENCIFVFFSLLWGNYQKPTANY